MEVHSSSLLSPNRAPNDLAEERRALSQQYSDTVSNANQQEPPVNSNGSSHQPLSKSENAHQTVEQDPSDESMFIDAMLTDLKNL